MHFLKFTRRLSAMMKISLSVSLAFLFILFVDSIVSTGAASVDGWEQGWELRQCAGRLAMPQAEAIQACAISFGNSPQPSQWE